ncbi:MAG: FecR domain-containing protein [Deltaproteobacteria bacterium]|nr:FecR domain-containing protein [Deltaproteobacteria bacterium]
MTSARLAPDDCELCTELAAQKAAGRSLCGEETEVLRTHLGSCPTCATDAAIVAATVGLGGPGPAPTLDRESRERWIDAVLHRESSARRMRWTFAALATAVVVAAVFAGVLLAAGGGESGDPAPEPPRFFLVAGEVRTSDGPARAGDEPAYRTAVEVGRGRAALRTCGGVDLFLDAATRVRVQADSAGACGIGLESGRLVVDAHGLRPGARFVVSTPAGRVEVTGTVFAVELVERDVEVRVLDGSVEVAGHPPVARRVIASHAILLTGGGPRSLTPPEAERDLRLADWFAHAAGEQPVLLDISSAVAGAEVVVDHRTLGPAPITALVAAGVHAVEVRDSAGRSVRERVEVRAPGPFVRRYVLDGPTESSELAVPVAPPAASAPTEPARTASGSALVDSAVLATPVRHVVEAVPTGAAPPAPTAPEPTPAVLLEEARRRRAGADWSGAETAYEELVARFPSTGEARVALVPLGTLRLEHLGDAVGALRAFETYLARAATGALAEEASWGRIQALRALGRDAAAVDALQEFLAAYPDSLLSGEANALLGTVEGAP